MASYEAVAPPGSRDWRHRLDSLQFAKYNISMHVLARPAIDAACRRHPDVDDWLWAWWNRTRLARWNSLADVRRDYPATDQVGCCLVFNVRGNRYRLVCRVTYANQWTRGTLLIKGFLTHAEYDQNRWKKDCA